MNLSSYRYNINNYLYIPTISFKLFINIKINILNYIII